MRMTITQRLLVRARAQEGVTIVVAMGVMLVTSLLLASAFVATRDDIGLSHTDTMQKQAYYAALAGVQEFEYQMQVNPNYWQTCAKPTNTLPQEKSASYTVTIMPAAGASECSTSNPISTVIESKGAAANTFRIESVGKAGVHPVEHHTIIATFKVTGFLNFIYYTNHEDEDPSLYNASATCTNPNTFYPSTSTCQLIQFATGDAINGPVHTNDAACVGGSASFGLSGHSPPDVVEFYRGLNANCRGTGTFYTATKSYIKGEDLPPPTSDTSLETYAAEEDKFSGLTDLVLEGATNEIAVTNAAVNGGVTKKYAWPSNGLIYVKQSSGGACEYTFKPYEADNSYEAGAETNCGNVYVHGTYSKPLTIGSSDDVIINGEIYPYGDKGGTPTGTATLGLIANNFVRVYHPVKQTYEGSGPELETAHNLKLESAAHKETITVTAKPGLGEEIKLEVKNQGSQFEVVIHNESGSKTLEKTGLLNKASQLVGLASTYVVYGEGAKYAEGATEKLKTLSAESLGRPEVIRIKPKSPNLGKEMKIEVKESASGTENEVILLNAKGEQLEKVTGLKEAKSLVGHSSTYAVYEKGKNYNSTDEKEKLRITSGSWLDETCEQNGQRETEKYNSTARECEYTDTPEECDASSENAGEDTVHGWGTLENPWIYAAILATTHSFVVDNFNCGPKALGELNLDGALAQNYRGIVGTGGSTISTGYLKDYKYDERLAVDEPPYFLSPLNAGWKVARETSPSGG